MSLLRVPKGLFKFLIFLVLLAAGLAIAAIRTQGGRDVIATQIELAFAKAFEGSLEIGRLHGNPLGTLRAANVRLRDPDGRTVVSVDTIVARLSVLDALGRDVTIRTAQFVRPAVIAVRSDSGSWNIADLFQLRAPSSGDGPKWRFRSADVEVADGRFQTVNEGTLPALIESGRVFDYTNARYTDIHGRLTVGLGDDQYLVDIINLHARALEPDVTIETFNGQFVATDSTASLGAIRLATKSSEVSLSGIATGFEGFGAFVAGESVETGMQLSIEAARIDSIEVAGIFPTLHIPNSSASLSAAGPRDDLIVEQLQISVGQSSLTARGSVEGLPSEAVFDLTVSQSSIDVAEIASLLDPGSTSIAHDIPAQSLTSSLTGSIDLEHPEALRGLILDGQFQTASPVGVFDGFVSFRGPADPAPEYQLDLNFVDFRIGRLAAELGASSVWNGHIEATGSGLTFDELAGTVQVDLTQSSLRGLPFDGLEATVSALGRSFGIDLAASGPAGALELTSSIDLRQDESRLVGSAALTDFELVRAVTGEATETRSEFTLSSQLSVTGTSIEDVSGFATVFVDSVTFFSPEDTVGLPASRHRVDLSHDSARETRVILRGDIFEGELEGLYTFGALSRVASLWIGAGGRTVAAQIDKKLHPDTSVSAESRLARTRHLSVQENTRGFIETLGFNDGLHLSGGLRVNRMLELNRLFPGVPEFASNVAVRSAARLGVDEIDLQVWLDADSLRGPTVEVDGLRGEVRVAGGYDSILEELVDSDISLDAERTSFGKNVIRDASLRFSYADRAGTLSLASSDEADDSLSVGLDAELSVLADRNEVVLSDVFLRQQDYKWEVTSDAVVDLFGDAVRLEGLQLTNQSSDTTVAPQWLRLEGIVSGHYADTLYLEAESVSLDQISELASFRDHLGGQVDASINVARALDRPELVGRIGVQSFSYVYRDVGDLIVTSSYSGQGEELFIDAVVTQPRELGPRVKGNEARIWGTIAIPGPDSEVPFGALDISVDAEEVDLFFFEVLFTTELQDVRGDASGTGRITGALAKPIFDADIQVNNVEFLSPPFNLRFGLSGPVTVDSLGFHLQDVAMTDPTGGSGVLRGDVLFNDYRFFSFNLSADLQDLQIMNVRRSEELAFYGEVWVSGSATLTGPLQRTLLRSTDVVTSPRSRLFLPVTDDIIESDQTFITFTDSTGAYEVAERRTMLDARPVTEREFIDGMDMNFNITIPPESNVFLVFDALLGDVIEARGSGRVQFLRFEGEYSAFGTLTISSGDYLFTAGEVFQRRFLLDPGGTITWDGDAVDAALSIPATYRTRASLAGLPGQNPEDRVPIRVNMTVTGRLSTPEVGLRIALDVDRREGTVIPPGLESAFNREDLAVEYATSVLLTNTFLLTSSSEADPTSSADDLLFNSLSHLVSSQVNRFVSQALDLDVNVGVQQGRTDNAYDLVYGFALRLDDQGLIIRGEGLYETTTTASSSQGIQGEFVVEYRLTPTVRLELFFRRESDLYRAASTLGTSYGAGIVYQTDFANWKSFGKREEPLRPEDEESEVDPAGSR